MRTGCAFKPLMSELFHTTKLTPQYVAKKSGFLDWNTQPSRFKRYPHFCFRYDRKALGEHAWLLDLRRITNVQNIGGGRVYERLNVPSAGNLHPLELYVQIRKVSGMISGIYHIDVEQDALVLIREIERDGLELHVGLTSRFMGKVISLPPMWDMTTMSPWSGEQHISQAPRAPCRSGPGSPTGLYWPKNSGQNSTLSTWLFQWTLSRVKPACGSSTPI